MLKLFSIETFAAARTSCRSFPLVVRLLVEPGSAVSEVLPFSVMIVMFSPVGLASERTSTKSGRKMPKRGDVSRWDSLRKAVADAM